MKLPLSLLRSCIDLDVDIATLKDTLTSLGIEVDAVHAETPPFSGVVVGEVVSARRHEQAQNQTGTLQICEVFDGAETLQVVCGAANCRAGLKVAFAKQGARLTDEKGHTRTIEKTTIRNASSSGMLCSASELCLYEGEPDAILELPASFQTGADCLALLWDPVLELSLTPNLGHCMSALGVARELSAALRISLRAQKRKAEQLRECAIRVAIHDETLCPRYAICRIENVTVKPSPFWLQRILQAAGFRPVNNVVDATNYCLLKNGQPLHAFDEAKIEGGAIHVQAADRLSAFVALTGASYEIPQGTLVIADARKPIAIAGIMGGENSAISESTRSIVLEAASFDPTAVRIASKKMGLRSDSSLRFEKGVDPSTVVQYLEEAAELIAELTGGHIACSVDCKEKEFHPRAILCRPMRVNQILGTQLSNNEIRDIFQRLQFDVQGSGDEAFTVHVPLFRSDLFEEIDLIEEVARIYGYRHIERPLPRSIQSQIPHDPEYVLETALRERLIALGLQELLTCDLISPKLLNIAQELSLNKHTFLQTLYSKSEEYSILRPSLLPGLLEVLRLNLDQKNQRIAAFEIGRIHFLQDKNPMECPMAALLLTGKNAPSHWDKKPSDVDFFDLKGLVENLFKSLRINSVLFSPSMHPTFHPGRQADLIAGSIKIGSLGELHPQLLDAFDIQQRVYYAECNVQYLQTLQGPAPKLTPLAQFPSSERDWTLSIEPTSTVDPLFKAIDAFAPPLLECYELIDVYRAPEKANITLRFTYRDRTKTISFEEVEAAHTLLIQEILAKTASPR